MNQATYSALVLPEALESSQPVFQAGTLPSKLEKHCQSYPESSGSFRSMRICVNYTIRLLAEHEGFEPSCLSTTPLAGGHHQPLGQCSMSALIVRWARPVLTTGNRGGPAHLGPVFHLLSYTILSKRPFVNHALHAAHGTDIHGWTRIPQYRIERSLAPFGGASVQMLLGLGGS